MSTGREVEAVLSAIKGVYAQRSRTQPPIASGFPGAFVPFNLADAAQFLKPVISPFRNIVPRLQRRGTFRRDAQTDKAFAAMFVLRHPDDPTAAILEAPIGIQSLHNQVTFTSQYGMGQVDFKAIEAANLLRAVMIGEESNLLYGEYGPEDCVGNLLLSTSPTAYNGLFAQMVEQMDHIHYAWAPPKMSPTIGEMAAEMAEANGSPPDLCLISVAQARRITRETLDGCGSPYILQVESRRSTIGAPRARRADPFSMLRVSQIAVPGRDETISVRVHPTMPDGECVLLTTFLPEKAAKMVAENNLQTEIPAPFSFQYEYDYLEIDYGPFNNEPVVPIEIRLMGAFMLHCPFLVGWIRGCPS